MGLRHSRSSRRLRWLLPAIFVLSLPAVTTRLYASDEVECYAWLRSWWFDHDVDFQNEYQHFFDTGVVRDAGFHETFLERTNEAGRRTNFAPIGSAVLWIPFFAAGGLAARVVHAPVDGFSHPYIASVAYGSAIYGFLGLLLTGRLVEKLFGGDPEATLAVWIGTPLLFYMYIAPGFAHACSAFAVSLFLWTWVRARERWTLRGAVLLGLSGGLMAMVREQDLLFVAGPAIDFLAGWSQTGSSGTATGGRSRPSSFTGMAIAGSVAFVAAYMPQLLAYDALNGHFGPPQKVTDKMTWTAPHFLQVLLSPEHGFFFWTPLAALAVAGLLWLAVAPAKDPVRRDLRWIAALSLVMFALQMYMSGSVESWTVAGSFGQRRFVGTTPILAIGLAALVPPWRASRAARVLRTVAVVACIWWNLGLMAQFGLHTMDRQRLTLAANARATFLTLPAEAPGLLRRYLFARSSFYGLPRQ